MPSAYSSRRASSSTYSRGRSNATRRNDAWAPNRNTVRNARKFSIGPIWSLVFVAILVVTMGMFYVTQCSGVTTFDHKIAEVNNEIVNLEAERDSLAVENAKIHAVAATEGQNEVAAAMVEANSGNFAE